MKKLIAVFFALALLFTGCSGGGSAPGFSGDDLYLEIDGTRFELMGDIQPVTDKLGEDYVYSEGMSCAYDSVDKYFAYDVATFYTNPLPEGDRVTEIYTESEAAATSKGIKVGASKEDVVAAYGEGNDTGNMLVYRHGAEGDADWGALCFDLDGDRVIAIFLTREPV